MPIKNVTWDGFGCQLQSLANCDGSKLRVCLHEVGQFGCVGDPTISSRLKIEATAQIRARTQLPNQLGTGILRGPPRRRAAKITTKRKIPLETSRYRDRGSIDNIDSHPTAKMADSDSPVTLRTRKFIRNPLLGRKQMVV